jgi:uncharacterized protein YlxW (UPF0749 family)
MKRRLDTAPRTLEGVEVTRMARLVLFPLLALLLGFGVACSDDNDGSIEDERANLERDINDQLDRLNAEIKELENEVQGEGGGTIDNEAQQRLDDLKDERADLENKLDDVRTASEERLQDLKKDLETQLNDLREQLE